MVIPRLKETGLLPISDILKKGTGGTGPGLFLPLMPVMYTKSVWLRHPQTGKGIIIFLLKPERFLTGILVHLWQSAAICLKEKQHQSLKKHS